MLAVSRPTLGELAEDSFSPDVNHYILLRKFRSEGHLKRGKEVVSLKPGTRRNLNWQPSDSNMT